MKWSEINFCHTSKVFCGAVKKLFRFHHREWWESYQPLEDRRCTWKMPLAWWWVTAKRHKKVSNRYNNHIVRLQELLLLPLTLKSVLTVRNFQSFCTRSGVGPLASSRAKLPRKRSIESWSARHKSHIKHRYSPKSYKHSFTLTHITHMICA